MTDSLGLSIGTTNLVAARGGRQPMSRQAVLTVFDDRAPEVGVAGENPDLTEPGLTVRGFVQRVGDPMPLVAADGSTHRGEQLLAEALDALARSAGRGAPVAVAVPAHWGSEPVAALRAALNNKPGLAPGGTPPPLISDAAAAIAALYADPGLPTDRVVALCDFGGSGSSITLVDAASNFAPIAATVRYGDFSGERIDSDIVNHVLAAVRSDTDAASTAAVGSLTRLRGECQRAKERLSTEPTTVIPVRLPGFVEDVPLHRVDVEQLVAAPLAGFVAAVTDTLTRNGLSAANLSAVATVGGGAGIPLIGARLSEQLRVPVVTRPRPAASAAVGGRVLAAQRRTGVDTTAAEAGAPTGMGPAADSPTGLAPAAPTSLAPAPWAAGMADRADSESFPQLAWSHEESQTEEPVPYSGKDYHFDTGEPSDETAGSGDYGSGDYGSGDYDDTEPEPLAWYKQPIAIFVLAATSALAAAGVLMYMLTSEHSPLPQQLKLPVGHDDHHKTPEPTVITVTAPNGETTVSTITPPPTTSDATSSSESPAPTTTKETPTTTKETPTTSEKPSSSAKPTHPSSSEAPTTEPEPATSEKHSTPQTSDEPPEPNNPTFQGHDDRPTTNDQTAPEPDGG